MPTVVGNFCAAVDLVNTEPTTKCCTPEFRSETDLEAAIEAAKQRMCAAPSWDEKFVHWRAMVRLMDQRLSPPSTSPGIAQATGECCGNAAGGVL